MNEFRKLESPMRVRMEAPFYGDHDVTVASRPVKAFVPVRIRLVTPNLANDRARERNRLQSERRRVQSPGWPPCSIGVDRHTPVFQTGIKGAIPLCCSTFWLASIAAMQRSLKPQSTGQHRGGPPFCSSSLTIKRDTSNVGDEGVIPSWSTNLYGPVAQEQEAIPSGGIQCRCNHDRDYHFSGGGIEGF